ncbi:HAD-IIB family hydrolase [Rubritalea tangerina]|uniref:HAD-IIB family hydrolase n=2 Tax=Rubritalea tangerina TaxID=430798 RepID=A0ABW4ZEI8_9BACT
MSGFQEHRYLVVTDLDSSLLDEDYGYAGAEDCLALMSEMGVPLVFNSSKTYAELRALASDVSVCSGVVAENGGMVGPRGNGPLCEAAGDSYGFCCQHSGMSRRRILEHVHGIREACGYRFEGFADWSVAEVVERTGLSVRGAELAMERESTEPIVWSDSEGAWNAFVMGLEAVGVRAVRGGRFIHLMGMVDKVGGMRWFSERYAEAYPEVHWTTVAVGDSENDLAMLEAADIPVVIPHVGGARIKPKHGAARVANSPGSAGWGQAVREIITS